MTHYLSNFLLFWYTKSFFETPVIILKYYDTMSWFWESFFSFFNRIGWNGLPYVTSTHYRGEKILRRVSYILATIIYLPYIFIFSSHWQNILLHIKSFYHKAQKHFCLFHASTWRYKQYSTYTWPVVSMLKWKEIRASHLFLWPQISCPQGHTVGL